MFSLPAYAREQLALAIAVMYKRGAIEESKLLNRQGIYDTFLHAVTSGDSNVVRSVIELKMYFYFHM